MLVSQRSHLTAARSTLYESFLDKIGFVNILYCSGILSKSCRDGSKPYGSPAELSYDCTQNFVVDFVESVAVDI